MQRDFYRFAIFFVGVYVIAALFHSALFFRIDYQLFRLPSFPNWFLVWISTLVIGSIFTLKYYRHKGYRWAWITGIIVLIAGLFQYIIFYLLLVIGGFEDYYTPAVIFSVGASLLYALSLMFSKAGKDRLLRALGISLLVVGGISVYLVALSLAHQGGPPHRAVLPLSQWASLAGGLMPVLWVLLFRRELKVLTAAHDGPAAPYRPSEFLYLLAAMAGVFTLVFGVKLGTQTYWKTHVPAHTKALAEPFEARSFINSKGETLQYRLLTPQDYDPNKKYPLVVCLHGGAGWGTDNYRQFDGALFARMLSQPGNRKKYPAFLFVPQCPPEAAWGGIPRFPAIDSLVFDAIAALEQAYPIDEDRLYVAGHSLGGYGTWHFIGTRPDRFAAAIPAAGEGDPALAANMVDVAVWAFHGSNDRNVPVSGSRAVIEAIREHGGDPRYTEDPDGGHGWKVVQDTPGVLEWLFAQQRNDNL